MRLRNRRGDTLIELVVATALFAFLLSSLFIFPNFVRTAGQENADRASALVKMMGAEQTMRAEWSSAERMQAGTVNPNDITSIAFKKDYSPYGQSAPNWVKYQISGNKLLRNGTDALSDTVIKSKMEKIGDDYFRLFFYAPNGSAVASNTKEIPKVQGVNDTATGYWVMALLFQYDGYPQVVSSERMATPDFETPVPLDQHTFSMPMDTTKYGHWNSDTCTTTDLSSLGDSDIHKFSSYLGIPAKWESEFINMHPTATGYAGKLYDPVRSKGIPNATVYLYTLKQKFVSTTDDNGNFFFIASSIKNLFVYYGDDNYEGCEKEYP